MVTVWLAGQGTPGPRSTDLGPAVVGVTDPPPETRKDILFNRLRSPTARGCHRTDHGATWGDVSAEQIVKGRRPCPATVCPREPQRLPRTVPHLATALWEEYGESHGFRDERRLVFPLPEMLLRGLAGPARVQLVPPLEGGGCWGFGGSVDLLSPSSPLPQP